MRHNISKSETRTKDTYGLVSKESSSSITSNPNKIDKPNPIENRIAKEEISQGKPEIKYCYNTGDIQNKNNNAHSNTQIKPMEIDEKKELVNDKIEDIKYYYEEKIARLKVQANNEALNHSMELTKYKTGYLRKKGALIEELEQLKAHIIQKESGYLDQILRINSEATNEKKNKLEVIQQLRNELNFKEKALVNLTVSNSSLQAKVLQLTKEIKDLTKQPDDTLDNKPKSQLKKSKRNHSVQIANPLSSRDKELCLSPSSRDLNPKDNQSVKYNFETFGDSIKKLDDLDEKLNGKDKEIDKLLHEKQTLINSNNIIKETNDKLTKDLTDLHAKLETSKETINSLSTKNQALEDQLQYYKYVSKNKPPRMLIKLPQVNKSKIYKNCKISTPNILLDWNEALGLNNAHTDNKLKVLSSTKDNMTSKSLSMKNYDTLFTSEEKAAIERQFNDESAFNNFIHKINQLESYKNYNESKLKAQIKQLQTQDYELNQKLESITKQLQEKETQIKKDSLVIADLQLYKKGMIKKNVDYKLQIEDLNNKIEGNEYEIKILNSKRKGYCKYGSQMRHGLSMEIINKDYELEISHNIIQNNNKTPMKMKTKHQLLNYVEIDQK